MAPLEAAIKDLQAVLDADREAAEWRWHVRQRLSAVSEALDDPQTLAAEGWLAAREGCALRRRRQLKARVSVLASGVLQRLDAEVVRGELGRLLVDLEHHVQRVHDLVYDAVSLELGGSE